MLDKAWLKATWDQAIHAMEGDIDAAVRVVAAEVEKVVSQYYTTKRPSWLRRLLWWRR